MRGNIRVWCLYIINFVRDRAFIAAGADELLLQWMMETDYA
jgi:hypothetical protein